MPDFPPVSLSVDVVRNDPKIERMVAEFEKWLADEDAGYTEALGLIWQFLEAFSDNPSEAHEGIVGKTEQFKP